MAGPRHHIVAFAENKTPKYDSTCAFHSLCIFHCHLISMPLPNMKHNYNIIPQADSSEHIIEYSRHSKSTTRKVLIIRTLIFLFLLLVGAVIGVSISSRVLGSRGCTKLLASPFGTYHTGFNTELLRVYPRIYKRPSS